MFAVPLLSDWKHLTAQDCGYAWADAGTPLFNEEIATADFGNLFLFLLCLPLLIDVLAVSVTFILKVLLSSSSRTHLSWIHKFLTSPLSLFVNRVVVDLICIFSEAWVCFGVLFFLSIWLVAHSLLIASPQAVVPVYFNI